MARRKGFVGALAQIQREIERSQREKIRAENELIRQQARAEREAERARKAAERAKAADERERKRLHQEAQTATVESMNARLQGELATLESLLPDTLAVDDYLDLEQLKEAFEPGRFDPGALGEPIPTPKQQAAPPSPSGLSKLRRKNVDAHERKLAELAEAHEAALAAHAKQEDERVQALERARHEHEQAIEAERVRIGLQHREIEAFARELETSEPTAVSSYFGLVLQASDYPEGFPRHSRVAYVPDSRQLVVEIDFPTIDVVPAVRQYRYVKARDEITETARAQRDIKAIYASAMAQMSLRTVHELFEADRDRWVDTVVFNGHVHAIDPGTGTEIHPCLVTLRTTKPVFEELDLARVEPIACLKALNAAVSTKPTELAPVKPVLEFSMLDPRFVEETDVLSELDQRVNLMDLTPKEFESLITNLFSRMGLDTKQTRPSRDGGVDCVAYDPRPIFGGKVVIQAKRYKNTVGVSAVRDLFGTVQNEGASKGILVTTSGYGSSSFEFADGKPLELLDGANLLFLLSEHAGLEAKIQAPDDWKDPEALS